jgi:hypothetical protein
VARLLLVFGLHSTLSSLSADERGGDVEGSGLIYGFATLCFVGVVESLFIVEGISLMIGSSSLRCTVMVSDRVDTSLYIIH